MQDQEREQSIEAVPREKTWDPPEGWEEEIADFEARNGVQVPQEMREWLCLGPGTYEVEESYRLHPIWRDKGWIPIARDGFGSDYVLDTACSVESRPGQPPTHPVYFMNHADDDERPSYVVASSFETFLDFMHEERKAFSQDEDSYWPFDKEKVLEKDPGLKAYCGEVPLPWET